MRMLLQTFAIMARSINQFELREADVVLRPKLVGVGAAARVLVVVALARWASGVKEVDMHRVYTAFETL